MVISEYRTIYHMFDALRRPILRVYARSRGQPSAKVHFLAKAQLHFLHILKWAQCHCVSFIVSRNNSASHNIRSGDHLSSYSPKEGKRTVTHWLVSVKLHSHLVSGGLFFQGVHKSIFEIV